MSACNLPNLNFSISIPGGLPSFPAFTMPVFTLAVSLSCPID